MRPWMLVIPSTMAAFGLSIAALLALAGCEPPPPAPIKCDYCHVLRDRVWRNACDKCGLVHVSCGVEEPLWHVDSKKTTLLGCPTPEPLLESPEPVKVEPKVQTEDIVVRYVYEFGSKKTMGAMILGLILAVLFGYRWGRLDERGKMGRTEK